MVFKVCAVVTTLNRQRSVMKCLDSLDGQEHLFLIVIVDDGSKPSLNLVGNSNPTIPYMVLRNEKPIGCCQSRNLAVKQLSRSTHVWFVDDDEILTPTCLSLLCDADIWKHESVAATGGSCIDMNVPDFHKMTWQYLTRPMAINDKGQICDSSEYWVTTNRWYQADHLRGGNLLVSLKAFHEVGGFSPEYQVGSFRGETDFCLKLREKGYKLFFNPVARALHYKLSHGGLRSTRNNECWYDNLWRGKWNSKKFLGGAQSFPPVRVRAVAHR